MLGMNDKREPIPGMNFLLPSLPLPQETPEQGSIPAVVSTKGASSASQGLRQEASGTTLQPAKLPASGATVSLAWHPSLPGTPGRKWPDRFQPLASRRRPSRLPGPGASPLWERCLPTPPLIFCRHAPPLGVCWSVLVSFYFARYENET